MDESLDPISRQLRGVHRRFAGLTEGNLADYIPELANVDSDQFGLALVSLQGHAYRAGDADALFTMQSVSKPFVYAMALAELGMDAVTDRIGVEPSGEAFNAISLEPETGRPANSMINAGAILTVSLLRGRDPFDRFGRILSTLSAFAGRELDIDEAVYRSELETGDRNRALAYLMRNAGALRADVDETLDVYFRQCAVRVSSVDIATMAATLANRGVNPVTGQRVVEADVASHVLTVMATCGMYNSSGNWLVRVGLPAKSGVSGALVAVSPGEFGIGLFSPRVDERGNSVRGIAACAELATQFELQLLNRPGAPARALYTLDIAEHSLGSDRWSRNDIPENLVIKGLQGDICFSDAEMLLRSFDPLLYARESDEPKLIVLDMRRVETISRAASGIISALISDLTVSGHRVAVVDASGQHQYDETHVFPTLDAALEQERL